MKIALIQPEALRSKEALWMLLALAAADCAGESCLVWRPEAKMETEFPAGNVVREENDRYISASDALLAKLSFGRSGREIFDTCGERYRDGKIVLLQKSLRGEEIWESVLPDSAGRLLSCASEAFDGWIADFARERGTAWRCAAETADVILLCVPAERETFAEARERYRTVREKVVYVFFCEDPREEALAEKLCDENGIGPERSIVWRGAERQLYRGSAAGERNHLLNEETDSAERKLLETVWEKACGVCRKF